MLPKAGVRSSLALGYCHVVPMGPRLGEVHSRGGVRPSDGRTEWTHRTGRLRIYDCRFRISDFKEGRPDGWANRAGCTSSAALAAFDEWLEKDSEAQRAVTRLSSSCGMASSAPPSSAGSGGVMTAICPPN